MCPRLGAHQSPRYRHDLHIRRERYVFSPPSPFFYGILIVFRFILLPQPQPSPAFELLIRRAFDPYELPLLVEAAFSSKDGPDIIRCLSGDDIQTFVDVIDEARSTFTYLRDIQLVDTDTHIFCRLGTGWARPFVTDPKEVSKIIVQDVSPPRSPSESPKDPPLL